MDLFLTYPVVPSYQFSFLFVVIPGIEQTRVYQGKCCAAELYAWLLYQLFICLFIYVNYSSIFSSAGVQA